MRKRGKTVQKPKAGPVYDSDDERAYGDAEVPDSKSHKYYHDDIDDFHEQREKVLLDRGVPQDEDSRMDSDDEEEVLAITSDEESDEEIQTYKKQLRKIKQYSKKEKMGSDLEDEADLDDSKAWGKRRSKYYGADVEDDDIDLSGSEEDEGTAALEEREALALQRKMAEELDEEDFGLDIFKPTKKIEESGKEQEKIVKDLSQMSRRDKLQLLKKESPELLTLIEDFKSKMSEVQDTLQPLMKLVHEKKLEGRAASYVDTKFRLSLNYCTNISFYMMLKSQQVPVRNHPVIKRLLQFRNLMKQLEPVDEKLQHELNDILTRLNNGEDVSFTQPVEPSKSSAFIRRKSKGNEKREERKLSALISDSDGEVEREEASGSTGGKAKKKKIAEANYETGDEKAALAYYQMMKEGRGKPEQEDGDGDIDMNQEEQDEDMGVENEEDPDAKRGITYQIEKNKGLTVHKKKELRNPRVKHRMKYRKAQIRRKGQVREARKEMVRYGGEISGIRAAVKRGVKLK